MKQYSIFTLQRNIGKALEELPFQITKHGKIVAVVNRYNVDSSTLNKPATKSFSPIVPATETYFHPVPKK